MISGHFFLNQITFKAMKNLILITGSEMNLTSNGKIEEIIVKNDIGIPYYNVLPIVSLEDFHICGVGKSCHWFTDGNIEILVSARVANQMLHKIFVMGIITQFRDRKNEEKLISKFVPLQTAYQADFPGK